MSASPWLLVCCFPGGGLCPAGRGGLSSSPSMAAWPLWFAFSVWGLSSGCSLGVIAVGSVGVAPGLAWLQDCPLRWGGCVASWCCGCLSCLPQPPLVDGFVLVWRRGPLGLVRQFPVRAWVGFPPVPVVLIWGGVCLFLPLPSLGRCMHWSVSGVSNYLSDCVAACRCVVGGFGPCSGSVCRVAYVHAWADGASCWIRLWLCRLGGCTSRFRGTCGVWEGWGFAGAFLWGGVAWCSPALVVPAWCLRVELSCPPWRVWRAGCCGRGFGGCVRFLRSCDRRPRWGGGCSAWCVVVAVLWPLWFLRVRLLFSVQWAGVWQCPVPVGVFVSFWGRELA